MSSFSSFIGLTTLISRSSYSSMWVYKYYTSMKYSVSSIEAINEFKLLKINEIYKIILYYLLVIIYSKQSEETLYYLYLTSLLNAIFYLSILNMHLFIYKSKNLMLIQTLIFASIFTIFNKFFNSIMIKLFLIFSVVLVLHIPIRNFRIGIVDLDKSCFDIEKSLVEMIISLLWVIYSILNELYCFFIIEIINLFFWSCVLTGYQIAAGDLSKEGKIYKFLVFVFWINDVNNTKIDIIKNNESKDYDNIILPP